MLLAPGHRGDPDRVSCTVTVTPAWGWDKGVPGPEVMRGKSLFLDSSGNRGAQRGGGMEGSLSLVGSGNRGTQQCPQQQQGGGCQRSLPITKQGGGGTEGSPAATGDGTAECLDGMGGPAHDKG